MAYQINCGTRGDDTAIERLVHVTKMRWRIERDYRELKQEFGLGHYGGRTWHGRRDYCRNRMWFLALFWR